MADQPHAEAPAAKPAGSNKMLLIVGMLVAAGASGGATFFLTRPKEAPPGQEAKVASKAKAPHAEGADEEDDGEESAADEPGKEHPVVNLPPFLVNLGDDFNEPHYLKVSVAVEVEGEGEEASKGFEGKSARVRGAVLMFLSGLKLEDVQGQENRKKIVSGVRKEVRKSAGRKLVRDVYITEMVVQ